MESTKMIITLLIILLSIQSLIFSIDYVLYGHKDTIWEIVSDGKNIYSVGADGMLKVWDEKLRIIQSFSTHDSWARCVAVNDKYIAVGGYKPDNTIKVFDKISGSLLYNLTGHSASIFSLIFYKDYLISGSSDNSIIVWKDFKIMKILKIHDSWVRKVSVINDKLISGDENGRLNIVDFKNFKLLKTYELKSMIISFISFNDNIFIGTSNGELYKVELKNLKISLLKKLENDIYAIHVIDNKLFISQLGDVMVIDLNTLKEIKKFSVSPSEITSITYLDNLLFLSNRQGEIFAYTPEGKYISKSSRHFYSAMKLALDEKYLYVARENGLLESYERNTSKKIWNYQFSTPIRSIYVYKQNIAVTTSNGELALLNNGKITQLIKLNNVGISMIQYNDNLIIGGYEILYSYSAGKLDKILELKNKWITALDYDKTISDKLFIGTNTGEIFEYNLKTKKLSEIFQLPSVVVKLMYKNSSIIALYLDGTVAEINKDNIKSYKSSVLPLYDGILENSKLVLVGENLKIDNKEINFESQIVSIVASKSSIYIGLSNGRVIEMQNYNPVRQFSSQIGKISTLFAGEIVISGHEDGKITIWEKDKDGNYVITKILDDHLDSVKKIVKYKDKIFSASSDRTIKVWDLKSGKLLNTLAGHKGYVWSLYITGDYLISGGWDGRVIVWDINSYKPVKIYETGFSITDIWSNSKDEIYVSSLEGYVAKVSPNGIVKKKISKDTLWSIDSFSGKIVNIYTAGWDGNVYVLNRDLEVIKTHKCHNSTVFKIMIFRNNIVTAGSDNTIKIWNNDFKLIMEYSNFRQSILSIAISDLTGEIITTNGERIIVVK
ncbi:MAG TPA: hypothetical protein PK390_00170 [Fervidobacterium nodosum]|nr:hypothetical protein [Fervidobacterium nodosum]